MKEKHGGNKIAMEAQIAALKALLKAKRAQREKPGTLGELRGLLKGKAQSSEEDIERAKLRFNP